MHPPEERNGDAKPHPTELADLVQFNSSGFFFEIALKSAIVEVSPEVA
jgi:hypothetical protein